MNERCNAKRQQGGPNARCKLVAGWGTDHSGVGRCRKHLGNTPNLRKHAAALTVERNAAKALRELRRGPIVSEPRVSPAEALLSTITEQAILVAYLRRQVETQLGDRWVGDVMAATSRGDLYEVSENERALVRMYRDALHDLNRMSKAAHEAGIAEQVVRIEDQRWQLMAQVVKRAIVRSGLGVEQRTALERAIGAELQVLAGTS